MHADVDRCMIDRTTKLDTMTPYYGKGNCFCVWPCPPPKKRDSMDKIVLSFMHAELLTPFDAQLPNLIQ